MYYQSQYENNGGSYYLPQQSMQLPRYMPLEDTLMKLENSNRIPSKDKFRMMPCKVYVRLHYLPLFRFNCIDIHHVWVMSLS